MGGASAVPMLGAALKMPVGKPRFLDMKPVADDPCASRELWGFSNTKTDARDKKLSVAGHEARRPLRKRPDNQSRTEQDARPRSVDQNSRRQLRECVAHEERGKQHAHRCCSKSKFLANFDIGNGKRRAVQVVNNSAGNEHQQCDHLHAPHLQ